MQGEIILKRRWRMVLSFLYSVRQEILAARSFRRSQMKYATHSRRLHRDEAGTARLMSSIPVFGMRLRAYDSGIRIKKEVNSPCAITKVVCSRPLK